jgi:hypothetical protein
MTSFSFIEACFAVNILFANYTAFADRVIAEDDFNKKISEESKAINLVIADASPVHKKLVRGRFSFLMNDVDRIFVDYKIWQKRIAKGAKGLSLLFAVVCLYILFSYEDGATLSKEWTWRLILPLPVYWLIALGVREVTYCRVDKIIEDFKEHELKYIRMDLQGISRKIKKLKKPKVE